MKQGNRLPRIAVVGRTNVGKSSLCNAFSGRRLTVVDNQPGVTRDRNYVLVNRFGFPFVVIDTGGLIGEEDSPLLDSVRAQAKIALAEADLIVGVFDGLAGLQPHDADVVQIIRRTEKPVLWVVNKCEKPVTAELSADFYQLGVDMLIPVSAAHKLGIRDLAHAIRDKLALQEGPVGPVGPEQDDQIRVAIVGKPNVGKSTFVNKIVGEDRVITSPIAGTTRDNVDVQVSRDGQNYLLIDTAGLRKKARVEDHTIERYSNLRTLKAVARADVAVLMLDAMSGAPGDQDQKIAGLVHQRGKGLVLVVNKWDLVEKDHRSVKDYERAVYAALPFCRYAPLIFTSAITGKRCPSVLDTVRVVHASARERVPTSELNRVLAAAFRERPPPVYRGMPIKLFFAVQVSVAPPTIILFVNYPKGLGESYERYLKNELRESYPFTGVDVKIEFRKRSEKSAARESNSNGQREQAIEAAANEAAQALPDQEDLCVES